MENSLHKWPNYKLRNYWQRLALGLESSAPFRRRIPIIQKTKQQKSQIGLEPVATYNGKH